MVTLRFYAELNDPLPPNRRGVDFQIRLRDRRTIKDLIEFLGVPHTKVDLILANGRSVDFSYIAQEGDRFSIYPVFELLNVKSLTRLRPVPLRKTRFVADANLGDFVRLMRALGFDVSFDPDWNREDIIDISRREHRIILTRSRKLLKFGKITHGILIRPRNTMQQVRYILERLDIRDTYDISVK
jgi:hypothetical protein